MAFFVPLLHLGSAAKTATGSVAGTGTLSGAGTRVVSATGSVAGVATVAGVGARTVQVTGTLAGRSGLWYADLSTDRARYELAKGTFDQAWGTDFSIAARIRLQDYSTSGSDYICTCWDANANERGIQFRLRNSDLYFSWSTDGTGATDDESQSTVDLQSASGVADGDPIWVAVSWREDNGASSSEVRFWWAADQNNIPTSWTQLGATDTVGAVDDIYDTVNEEFRVGSNFIGWGDLDVFELVVFSDITGSYEPGSTESIRFHAGEVNAGVSEYSWSGTNASIESEPAAKFQRELLRTAEVAGVGAVVGVGVHIAPRTGTLGGAAALSGRPTLTQVSRSFGVGKIISGLSKDERRAEIKNS